MTGAEVQNLQWHDLVLSNGWTDYNKPPTKPSPRTPGWAIDAQGIVHLRGEITSGTLYQSAFRTVFPSPPPVDHTSLDGVTYALK